MPYPFPFSYKKHIENNHPKEILDVDTFLKIRSETLAKTISYQFDEDQEAGLDEPLPVPESTDLDAPPGMIPSLVS